MDQKTVIEYLRRSYFAVDGLWFMMIEDEFSFDKAMEEDEKVWRVLPKIQARMAKKLLEIDGNDLLDFLKAIKVKLEAEEYSYRINISEENHVQIAINKCPWYDILKKANREHIASRIADSVCFLEFQVWLSEFDNNYTVSFESRCCTGNSECLLNFHSS